MKPPVPANSGEDAPPPTIEWPEHYGRVVTPVFRETAPRALDFCGSAVLIAGDDGSPWLISAAHVLAEMEHSPLVVVASRSAYCYIVTVGKAVSTCELTPKHAANDRTDLAFVQLNSTIAERLREDFQFLPIAATDHSRHLPFAVPCMLDGYPRAFVEMENGRPRTLMEMRTQSILLPDEAVRRRYGLAIGVHLVAPFQQMRDGAKQPMATPDPEGMSGGAIWTQSPGEVLLTGIIIEHDPKRREIVGTRIGRLAAELSRRIAVSKLNS